MSFLSYLRRAAASSSGFWITPTKQSPWIILAAAWIAAKASDHWATWQDILGLSAFFVLFYVVFVGVNALTRDKG